MFIGRRPDGSIYAVWGVRQLDDEFHQGQEEVPNNHPDLAAVLMPNPTLVVAVEKLQVDLANVQANVQIVQFLKMSPAEIDAYINTNITDANAGSVNAIKTILGVLAKVVAVQARRSIF